MTTGLQREFSWTGHLRWGERPGEADSAALDPALMSSLLDHITARVAVIDRDHCYRYANGEAAGFFGLTPKQIAGRHLADVIGRASYEGYLPWAERLFGGESLRWQGWVEYPVRGRRFIQETMVPYGPAGEPVQAIVVFGRDHTELKLHEEALARQVEQLRASEALKSAIVDHALAALISTDGQGCIVEFNPSAEAMFGHRRAEVLGRRVSEVVMPERYRAAHDAGMARLAGGGAPRVLGRRMELFGLRADGREFPIEMVLWRSDVGGTVFYTASMVDVTERHGAAQQIERQREALRQSEKLTAMGSLLAGVAHELNNPLAIVMGRASLLEEKCEDDALKADVLRIREAAERCGRIVRTFLDMARSKPPQRGTIDINDLVRAAVEMLHYGYRTHGIELETELEAALPAINADGDQIGQVVLNLLINAQQALAGQGTRRRVKVQTGVEARRDNRAQRVWLRVADSGPGVSPEHAARVFEPFFTTKAEGIGTGLGLAVSRSLAREHGGDLILEATGAEGGASFRLSVPVSGVADEAVVALRAEPAEAPAQARLLVVDDEAELLGLMREMLEGAGYDVATAESGAVALEMLETARFDAIVSDLRMPDVDGAALWREVSRRRPQLARHMLFVTGDTLSPDAREFLKEARCTGLDKPFSKADLLARVAALVA
ncbi:PAS domain S-box protein [Rhizobacter sp. P5_C2]